MENWYDEIDLKNLDKPIIKNGLIFLSVCSSLYFGKQYYDKRRSNKKLKKKQAELTERKVRLFQKLNGMGSPVNNIENICYSMTGQGISEAIKENKLKAVDILEAYQINALLKNDNLNFIADIIYDADVQSLMIDSKDRDKELLGWPVSVKDCLGVAKYDCTSGMPWKCHQPCTEDSRVVQALKSAGANVFLITTACQGLIAFETWGAVYGDNPTANPHNPKMTAGGSSGGEAAAIASHASLCGLGNDSGGSVRVPAHYCGIVGFKPTAGRITNNGTQSVYTQANPLIQESIGPMARNVSDAVQLFKVLTSAEMYESDPILPPLPFNRESYEDKRPLRLGYYSDISGEITCVGAVHRAIQITRDALIHEGHSLVPFELPRIHPDKIISVVFMEVFLADRGQSILDGFKDDPVPPPINCLLTGLRMPQWFKGMIAYILRPINPMLSYGIRSMMGSSTYQEWMLLSEIAEYKQQLVELMQEKQLDGLICPVSPIAAPPNNTVVETSSTDSYSCLWNLLNFPAGTVPVTRVNNDDLIGLSANYKSPYLTNEIKRVQTKSLNMPVGVQCVALPWRDETCLRIMKEVELALHKEHQQ